MSYPQDSDDDRLHAALDGELIRGEQAEFERWLAGNPEALERLTALRQLTNLVDELGTIAPPDDLVGDTVRAVTRRSPGGASGGWVSQGEMLMAKKTMIGLAAAAAVVLVTFAVLGYPPTGKGTEGTIGQATRYQAAQPQMAASDVKLGDTSAQQFMQSDAFDRLIKDETARKLLADGAVRQALADPMVAMALADPAVAAALADGAVARALSNEGLARAMRADGFARALADPAVVQALSDPAMVRALSDPAVVRALSSDAMVRALSQDAVARALSSDAVRRALADGMLAKALQSSAFRSALQSDGFAAALMTPKFAAAVAN